MGRMKLDESERRITRTYTIAPETVQRLDEMRSGKKSAGQLIDESIKILDYLRYKNNNDDSYLFIIDMLDAYEKAKQTAMSAGKNEWEWKAVLKDSLDLYKAKYDRAERREAKKQEEAKAKTKRSRKPKSEAPEA